MNSVGTSKATSTKTSVASAAPAVTDPKKSLRDRVAAAPCQASDWPSRPSMYSRGVSLAESGPTRLRDYATRIVAVVMLSGSDVRPLCEPRTSSASTVAMPSTTSPKME